MKECDLGEGKVLVIKDGDNLYATGHKCSHYNAPLKSGVRFLLDLRILIILLLIMEIAVSFPFMYLTTY